MILTSDGEISSKVKLFITHKKEEQNLHLLYYLTTGFINASMPSAIMQKRMYMDLEYRKNTIHYT